MTKPYITKGCPTTGGGTVISGDSSFLVNGIPIACVGDKAVIPPLLIGVKSRNS